MVWAWIGVGVTYFSSARARRIGSARPKSLKEVKRSLSYTAKRPPRLCEAAESRGLRTSRVARVVVSSGSGGRGEILLSKLISSFVHAARRPQDRSNSSAAGHMTARSVLFKAEPELGSTLQSLRPVRSRLDGHRPDRSGNVRPRNGLRQAFGARSMPSPRASQALVAFHRSRSHPRPLRPDLRAPARRLGRQCHQDRDASPS